MYGKFSTIFVLKNSAVQTLPVFFSKFPSDSGFLNYNPFTLFSQNEESVKT